jgi:hypothetical protein
LFISQAEESPASVMDKHGNYQADVFGLRFRLEL